MRRAGHLAGQEPGVSLSVGRIVSLANNVFVCVVYVVIVNVIVFTIILSFQEHCQNWLSSSSVSEVTSTMLILNGALYPLNWFAAFARNICGLRKRSRVWD